MRVGLTKAVKHSQQADSSHMAKAMGANEVRDYSVYAQAPHKAIHAIVKSTPHVPAQRQFQQLVTLPFVLFLHNFLSFRNRTKENSAGCLYASVNVMRRAL
jgi:hypothetical protein